MRKSTSTRLRTRRAVAAGLSLLFAVTSVPNGTYSALAAAKKPAIAKKASVTINGTKKLKITKNGYKISSVKWKTSKKTVAKVKGTKKAVTIYGIKSGSAKVTATVKAKKNGKTKKFKLTTKVTVQKLTASLGASSLTVGEASSVTVSGAPKKASISYASDNAAVASVAADGTVNALAVGTAKITAKVVLPKTKYAKKATKTLTAGTVTVTADAASAAPSASSTASAAPSTSSTASAVPSASADASQTPAAAAEAEAEEFLTNQATILAKTVDTIAVGDKSDVNTALTAYDSLSDGAKAVEGVVDAKSLLDSLAAKITELEVAAEAEEFLTNQATVLAKTVDDIAVSDKSDVNAALTAYDSLSDGAKAVQGVVDAKSLLDSLAAKITELEVAAEAEEFLTNQATILAKTVDDIAVSDKSDVNAALTAYDSLSDGAKAVQDVVDAKSLLDSLAAKITELEN